MLKLPIALRAFAEALKADGVTLYAVGGCVRDALLGRDVHDVDLASRLLPDELTEKAAAHGIDARIVQKTLGTVLITIDGTDYEHTTFRTESYGAGGAHRPDATAFSESLADDAFRRDFSVNALYESVADGSLVDPTGGLSDLDRHVLRTTTKDPAVILKDDGLRILRLVRFAAALDFAVDPETWAAAKANISLLNDVAWERKRQELEKILLGPNVFDALSMLHALGAMVYLLQEFLECDGMEQRKEYHQYDVLQHLFHACENTAPELGIRLAALLHDVGKPATKRRDGNLYAHDVDSAQIARTALTRLRFPNDLIGRVCKAIRVHMFDLTETASDATVKKRFAQLGREGTEDLIALREADIRGSGYRTDYIAERWRRVYREMTDAHAPFSEGELSVTGEDIMKELGLKPCERVGRIKRQLFLRCAVHPEENVRTVLLKRMHDYL